MRALPFALPSASAVRTDLPLVAAAVPVLLITGAAVAIAGERFGVFKLVWVLAALLGAIVSVSDLRTAVLVLLVALGIPFRTEFVGGIEIHTTHLLLAMMTLQVAALAHAGTLQIPRGYLRPFALIVAGGVLAAVSGPEPAGSLSRLAHGVLLPGVAGLAIGAVVSAQRGVSGLAQAVCVGLVLTAIVAFAQAAGVAPEAVAPLFEANRVNGAMYHPNILAGFASAEVLLLVGVAAYAWRRFRLGAPIFLVPICFGVGVVAVTLSRGALLGLTCGVFAILGVLTARRRVAPLVVVLFTVAAILAVAIPKVPESQRAAFVQRIQQLQQPGAESGRSLIYRQARETISEYWTTGVGALTFGRMIRRRATVGGIEAGLLHAHSILPEAWLSLGPLGLLGVVWLVGGALTRLWRLTREGAADPIAAGWALGAFGALASMLVQGAADFLLWQIELMVLAFALIGSAYGLASPRRD